MRYILIDPRFRQGISSGTLPNWKLYLFSEVTPPLKALLGDNCQEETIASGTESP